jgi:hypothetical protein
MRKEHDQPPACMVHVQSDEQRQMRLRILEGIARGEKDVEENNTYSNEAAKEKIKKWLK